MWQSCLVIFGGILSARILIIKKEKTRHIYLATSAIPDAAGPHVCDALLGLHAFTGYDSTSAFAGKGKKTALKLCKKDPMACDGMATLGRSFDAEKIPFSECEGFVCNDKPKQVEVNECRYITS